MCFINSCCFLTDNGYVSVDKLLISNILSKGLIINDIYRLPEYKVVKMVRICKDDLGENIPTITTYLKPSQYMRYQGSIIKASELVDKFKVAEYERYQIIEFYLISVKNDNNSDINEYVTCNGLELSVYNYKHPLNNRFKKLSITKNTL